MKKHNQLSFKVLRILGAGAVIAVASVLSPTLPYALLRGYLKNKSEFRYTRDQIDSSLKYLKRKKFIAFEFKQNKLKILVTKVGRRHLAKTSINEIQVKSISWDERWRLLTFDIPEGQKNVRQTFRRKLKDLGFFHLQRSVFILPYPCELELNELADILQLRKYMFLLTCDRFAGDEALVKKFKLQA